MQRIKANAVDVLKQIVEKKGWHKGLIKNHAMVKSDVLKNELSYKKTCKILAVLGWHKVREETWEKTNHTK